MDGGRDGCGGTGCESMGRHGMRWMECDGTGWSWMNEMNGLGLIGLDGMGCLGRESCGGMG